MNNNLKKKLNRGNFLLQFLPSIFHQKEKDNAFTKNFFHIFEKILIGDENEDRYLFDLNYKRHIKVFEDFDQEIPGLSDFKILLKNAGYLLSDYCFVEKLKIISEWWIVDKKDGKIFSIKEEDGNLFKVYLSSSAKEYLFSFPSNIDILAGIKKVFRENQCEFSNEMYCLRKDSQLLQLNLEKKYLGSLNNEKFPTLTEKDKFIFEKNVGKLPEDYTNKLKIKTLNKALRWKFNLNSREFVFEKNHNELNIWKKQKQEFFPITEKDDFWYFMLKFEEFDLDGSELIDLNKSEYYDIGYDGGVAIFKNEGKEIFRVSKKNFRYPQKIKEKFAEEQISLSQNLFLKLKDGTELFLKEYKGKWWGLEEFKLFECSILFDFQRRINYRFIFNEYQDEFNIYLALNAFPPANREEVMEIDYFNNSRKGIHETIDILAELFHPKFSFLFREKKHIDILEFNTLKKQIFASYFTNENVVSDNKFAENEFLDWLDNFLEWFSKNLALVLREDWSLQKKREVISKIIPIYRTRGTIVGLENYLSIYLDVDNIKISNRGPSFIVREEEHPDNPRVGKISSGIIVGGPRSPYVFYLKIKNPKIFEKTISNGEGEEKDILLEVTDRVKLRIKEIVQQEKPAHTTCQLLLENIPIFKGRISKKENIDLLHKSLKEKVLEPLKNEIKKIEKIEKAFNDKKLERFRSQDWKIHINKKNAYYLIKNNKHYDIYITSSKKIDSIKSLKIKPAE